MTVSVNIGVNGIQCFVLRQKGTNISEQCATRYCSVIMTRRQTTNDTCFSSGVFIITSFKLLIGLQLCEKTTNTTSSKSIRKFIVNQENTLTNLP
jgi:hypothetical protein